MKQPDLPTSHIAFPAGLRPHRPAIPAFCAFAGGILLDRFLPLTWNDWLLLGIVAASLTLLLRFASRQRRAKPWSGIGESTCVLLAVLAAGGAREHFCWEMLPANSIAAFTSVEPQTARIRGIIASPIEIEEAKVGPRIPAWMEIDRSKARFECQQLEESGVWKSVSGTLQLEVSGHLVHTRVGDQVEVIGHLSRPGPPRNPGAMDFQEYLKSQGIEGILRVEHPVAVRKLQTLTGVRWFLARARDQIRQECLRNFAANLTPAENEITSSMLLGDRTLLSDGLKEEFAESGTMHLLAISGLHVAILLGLVLKLCRLNLISPRSTALILLVTTVGYAFLTDHRPPVLRAGLLATLAVFGTLTSRKIDSANLLAACGLLLLIWQPTDLFDIGAQLSFLAIAAILWAASWKWRGGVDRQDEYLLQEDRSRWQKRLHAGRVGFLQIYFMTVAIWLVTLPLTLLYFHLVSPVGIVLNVILIPYIGIVLGCGYVFLFGSLLAPAAASLLAVPYRWTLWPLLQAVNWGHSLPYGHFYLPSFPVWWVVGFYGCLAGVWLWRRLRPGSFWGLNVLLCWSVVGLSLPLLPTENRSLRVTFLSVGHGLASVIEFPSGRTMLYDVGTIGDGERASRAVANLLWSRGIARLDGVIISHADHDHFSGLFGLLELFPIDTLFVHQSFLDFDQASVRELCELAAGKQIPIRLLQYSDELISRSEEEISPRVQVLAPERTGPKRSDNANSLVLALQFAGRSLLLTGDLEKEGLSELLERPPQQFDVLLSPHHGGKVANVLKLYEWAQPRAAVVSSQEESLPSLSGAPQTCSIFNTATSGAVTVEIDHLGAIGIREFLPLQTTDEEQVMR